MYVRIIFEVQRYKNIETALATIRSCVECEVSAELGFCGRRC